MPDIDDRLRDYAGRWRAIQPPPPEPEFRPVRTPRTPWRAMSAAAAVLLVVGLAVAVPRLSGGPAVTAADPPPRVTVAWDPAGWAPFRDPVRTPSSPSARVGDPNCTAGDFRLTFADTTAEPTGGAVLRYVLTHVGARPCAVSQLGVSGTLVDAAGAALPRPVSPLPSIAMRQLRVGPGEQLTDEVGVVVAPRGPRPAALRVLDGIDVPLDPAEVRVTPGLGMTVVLITLNLRVVTTGTIAALTPTVTAPPAIRPGETLRYTVELTNHSAVPVRLGSCPEVVQQLSRTDRTLLTGARGPVACPATVEPGGTVRVEMELGTTGLTPTGGRLDWWLTDGGTALVGAAAPVTLR